MNKFIVCALIYLASVTSANAEFVYESATGAFDQTVCCGSLIRNDQFIGAIFTLDNTTAINGIGGHFNNFDYSNFNGSIFGALVKLNNDQLPTGTLTNLDDVIAYSVFIPNSQTETLAPIQATLASGKYGLVFGSGLFGAKGSSTLTLLQSTAYTSDGELIALNTSSLPQWSYMNEPTTNRYRMFITGEQVATVPEPETYAMMLAGISLIGFAAKRRKLRIN